MVRSFCCIVLSTAIATLSCSGSEKPKPKSEPAPTWSDDTSPSDDPVATDDTGDDTPDDVGDPSDPPPKKPKERPIDYDITYSDCKELARIYGIAWRNGELKKLQAKKLKPKQQQAIEATIRKNAQEAQDQWRGECDGTVGSPQVRSRLSCALKAKTLDRFNDCLDGKVE